MEAPMLKRRLNPFLLVSTVLILSLLAGLSVLYQGQLDNVVSDKKSLKQELQDKNNQIKQLKAEKSDLSQKLGEKSGSLSELRKLYESTKEKLNSTSDELEEVKSERDMWKSHAEDLNTSLEFTCIDSNNLTDTAEDQCEKWGYR